MPRMTKGYKLLDPETGEIGPIRVSFHKEVQGGKFMKLWQDSILYFIKRHSEVRGFSLRLLLYMTAKAEWNNRVPTPHQASVELKLPETSCYRAYTELNKADFILKREGDYFINPVYCWKGSDEQYKEAMKTTFSQLGWKKLTPPRIKSRVDTKG